MNYNVIEYLNENDVAVYADLVFGNIHDNISMKIIPVFDYKKDFSELSKCETTEDKIRFLQKTIVPIMQESLYIAYDREEKEVTSTIISNQYYSQLLVLTDVDDDYIETIENVIEEHKYEISDSRYIPFKYNHISVLKRKNNG